MKEKVHQADLIDNDEHSTQNTSLLANQQQFPSVLTLLPLSNRPLFPGLIIPLVYEGKEMIKLVRNLAASKQGMIGLIMVKDEDLPFAANNIHDVGVVTRIMKAIELEGDGLHLMVECMQRFRIQQIIDETQPLRATVHYHRPQSVPDHVEVRAYMLAIINTVKELLKHNPLHEEELKTFAARIGLEDPNRLVDFAASLTTANRDELQEILACYDLFERMKKVITLLNREVSISKVQKKIRNTIEDRLSDQQRRYFLQEQLHEIQRELGLEQDPREQEIKRFKSMAKKLRLSKEAKTRFAEELRKLQMQDPSNPEFSVTRNYLDCLLTLPWGKQAKERFSLNTAARELNKHHSGLDDVKDRILEFIAVAARKKSISGSILLFVGPPGVGKTSLGRAIAAALHRPFYRFSVGGMHDEAEIKGHRRTYIGAMPGKFIQALQQCKASNPVLMIDEVDKMGSDVRGDPSSALLEVLDPEQQQHFLDHYLDVRFDLSKVLFLLTANQLDSIPAALRDRAEIIRLPGYMADEKKDIARKHLWPQQLKQHGLSRSEVQLSDTALSLLIESYAREPGVRGLERLLKKILRRSARALEEGKKKAPIRIGKRSLYDFIGKPRFRAEALRLQIGVANGLAWTSMGGVSLPIEAALIHRDRRGLKLTGQLGKVMQESAEIAYSFLLTHCKDYDIDKDFFDKAMLHIHVPEGAVPKDGPSAGISIATAILSLARQEPPQAIAMTGELSLTGEVLAIGGEREKILAAKRLGLQEVLLPEGNRVDVEELPDSVRKDIQIHYAKHFNDVAKLLFKLNLSA